MKTRKLVEEERLDEMANEITKEIIEKLYKVTNYHLSYSDLDIEGDNFNRASSHIMDLVIKKIKY